MYSENDSAIEQQDIPAQRKRPRRINNYIRPKVSTEWKHNDVLKLIAAVEQKPSIWRISTPEYKLPQRSVWQEISNLFEDKTLNECRAKWTNLRVTYNVNLKKKNSQESGTAADGLIKWQYFYPMKFLDANKTSKRYQSVSSTVWQESEPDSSDNNFEESDIIIYDPESGETDVDEPDVLTIDQFDVFAANLSTKLRNLSPSKALIAKAKIAQAIDDIIEEVEKHD